MSLRIFSAFVTGVVLWVLYGAATDEDGPRGFVLDMIYEFPTTYTSQYSWEAFNAVAIGRSEPEVVRSLGIPLTKWRYVHQGENVDVFQYSLPAGQRGHYRQRDIHMKGSKVFRIVTSAFVD